MTLIILCSTENLFVLILNLRIILKKCLSISNKTKKISFKNAAFGHFEKNAFFKSANYRSRSLNNLMTMEGDYILDFGAKGANIQYILGEYRIFTMQDPKWFI